MFQGSWEGVLEQVEKCEPVCEEQTDAAVGEVVGKG